MTTATTTASVGDRNLHAFIFHAAPQAIVGDVSSDLGFRIKDPISVLKRPAGAIRASCLQRVGKVGLLLNLSPAILRGREESTGYGIPGLGNGVGATPQI